MVILLGLTSNTFSIQKIGTIFWKKLHFLVFPIYLFSMLHVWYLWRIDWLYGGFTVIIILARIVSGVSRRYRRKNAWKVTKYLCPPCWFIYDEKFGDIDGWLAPWTKFEDIPDDWVCPVCGVKKSDFIPYYESEKKSFISSKIMKKSFVTKDVIHLSISWETLWKCSPWQYLSLIFNDMDGDFSRSYSIVSYENNQIELYIKIKAEGRAGIILKKLQVWDILQISWVYGDFILKNTSLAKVFIATGTWIAPIICMLLHSDYSKKNILYFWVSKKEDIFWLEKISQIKNLELHIFLSQEKVKWYSYWRVNLSEWKFEKNTEFYICWNPNMVEDISKKLRESWYTYIFSEKFI